MKQDGKYRFGRIMERDIDVMLLHSFSMDTGFLPLFLQKLNSDSFPNAQLIDVELSKADPYWGESDVTVRFTSGSRKYALLIEDKVGAVAQPEQCSRYDERGKIGIENAEYDAFFVFICASRKYIDVNEEAKKYPYWMSFEEMDAYFCTQGDTFSQIRHEQMQQALYYVKHPYAKDPNTPATEFWKAFVSFVHTEHPDLQLVNKSPIKSKTGDWPVYYTMLNLNNQVYIQHKMDRGIIDLTFAGMADRQAKLSDFLKSRIGDYENAGFGIASAGKSAVLRAIHDKPLDFQLSFDEQAETAKAHVDLLYRLHLIARQLKREDVLELLENDTHTP